MNYGSMSVRELVREIAREESLAHDVGVTGDDWASLKELEAALRKAVIREASGGVMYLGMIQRRRRMASSIRDLPDGSYDLIPKETP